MLPPVEAVPFAAEPDVPHRDTVAPDCGDDPIRLLNLDARIVLAVDDQKRSLDQCGIFQRRDGAKELPCVGVALIAVLGPPARDGEVKGFIEAGLEAGDPRDIDPRPEPVAVVHHGRKGHVAAVKSHP